MVKRLWLCYLALLLAGCSGPAARTLIYPTERTGAQGDTSLPETGRLTGNDLPDLGPAPELENDVWLNTDQPLRLEDLRGKVVLIDMWTFG